MSTISIPEIHAVKDNGLPPLPATPARWKTYELIAFRIAFIFFIAISIPNNLEWYSHVAHINWLRLHYRDLYDIARFGSGINFFGNTIFGSSLYGYANWIITLLIAIAGGFIWTAIDSRRKSPAQEYNRLYYWLRVVVRYRAGIGIIGFGFTKLLPVQMPFPSLGLLNTNFGDFSAQKIYWLSIGIVPWYQVFAGIVEVTAGTLLFFRKTTTLGAALLVGALGDIVYVNFAYDGGVHVYSSYFVLLGGFLLVKDIPVLYRFWIRETYTTPSCYYPVLSKAWQYARITLKAGVIVLFLGVLYYLQYVNYKFDPYKQPSTAGVKALRGNYRVTEFRINNRVIPYDPTDSVRWQQVTFEKWTTLTYKANRATFIDLSNGGGGPMRDINRTFELTGTGGGQRVFHYYADTIDHVLYLQDKYKAIPDRRNRVAGDSDGDRQSPYARRQKPDDTIDGSWISAAAWAHIGNENHMIDKTVWTARRDREFAAAPKNEKRNRMVLQYETTDGAHIILKGTDEHKDSLYIVLDRINRPYQVKPSTLDAGKY
ncbi:MAG TPA: hypothetical protein VFS25_23600 [Chitinophaga sp.]|uniref:hypothetical protein n=1 Tax=Chitinophaga sp. TaxID=1869181 RepID=UPI002DBEED18|nr:hypothetical protein [Chitinophaga sp.]HEU4555850.1 hypothetical protein [Chitinophaga sp.]